MPELSFLQGAARVYWMRRSFGTDVPFYDQASLGGEALFVGSKDICFIDKGAWEVEAEQRVTLFQTHFGATADWRIDPFVAVGQSMAMGRRPGRTCASPGEPGYVP